MLIACAVIHASLFSAQPILPLYIAQLQGSMDNIMMLSGTIFSVCAISIMIASPILGAAGQRFGFLKVLSCSLFFAGLLISAQVLGRTPFEFGVWRFIAGFAIAGLIPLVNSIISTECPPDKKGEVFGFNFLTGHAGMALGPFAAGALSGWFGYQAVIVASGLILFPCFSTHKVCITICPDWQMIKMRHRQLIHIRFLYIHIKSSNPFIICRVFIPLYFFRLLTCPSQLQISSRTLLSFSLPVQVSHQTVFSHVPVHLSSAAKSLLRWHFLCLSQIHSVFRKPGHPPLHSLSARHP